MPKVIKLKKGLDIRLKGKAEKVLVKSGLAKKFALKPTDFHNIRPKLIHKEGETVKVGTPLFYDKYNPRILFTSPVSGKITAVNRGERRRIEEIVIETGKDLLYEKFGSADPSSLKREEIVEKLLQSGVWPFIRQRPYGIIARPDETPRDIFISAFDTAPLAPDYDFLMKGFGNEFQAGVDVLAKLTKGEVHLGINSGYPSDVFTKTKKVTIHRFSGSHPAGNVGVHIHHIAPVHKNGVVWYVNPQDVVIIGRLFLKGVFDASRIVALTGSEVLKPRYYKTYMGASVSGMVKDNVTEGVKHRYISGNVLTGSRMAADGYIGFYDSHVTVIPEGDHYQFMGWAMPNLHKFSSSRAFFSWLMPGKEYRLDTNYNGGERAFVMSGELEKVLPMNLLPEHLIKAIMIEDIDSMENLGIYEVVEEDLALCEFVCTSKIELQHILRHGIETMIKETS